MLPLRRALSFCLLFIALSVSASIQSFENTAIVRTVELGGAVVHVTTTYAVRALEDNARVYTLALSSSERSKTSWREAKLKGQQKPLAIQEHTVDTGKNYHLVDITLPKPLSANKTATIVVETVLAHATFPWPESAAQNDEQALKYITDLFVLSPYSTGVQRTKLRAIAPRIISYTTPENVDNFVKDSSATKSGATVTYGPFEDIPPSVNEEFISQYQQPVTVHYYHDQPVLEILKLKRSVEISHWGANVNTQDDIILHNAGPTLKGHFSRLEHQSQTYYKKASPHVLPALSLHLPAGIRNTYYYDQIGNVSTSRLRVAPSVPKGRQGSQFSILELRPRYPLLGGWNYSFTLGWDSPLPDTTSYDKSTGKYIVEVPIMTPYPGAVVNDAEVNIILPEGATDIEFFPPFPAVENRISTHVTYLDTIGRPQLAFEYKDLTIKQAQNIYVSYKVSTSAHLKKPIAVATAFFSVFVFGFLARRINLTIHEKKKL